MTGLRRELMHRVLDGEQRLLPVLHFLDQFKRCDDMLRWLIRSRLTGWNFWHWSQGQFGRSLDGMARFILSQLEKDEERPVFYGRDIA